MRRLEGIDEAVDKLKDNLERELAALRANGELSVSEEDEVRAEDIDTLMIKVRLLLESADPDRFQAHTEFETDDWALLAAFWITYINCWSLHWPILSLNGILDRQVQTLLEQRNEELSPAGTEGYLAVLTPLIKLLLGGLPVYPWERTWLLPSAIAAIPWLEGEADWICFAISEQERIKNADKLGNSISQLLSMIKLQQTTEQKYRFYIEDWLYRHDFDEAVQADIRAENEEAAPAEQVNDLPLLEDDVKGEEEPDEEILAAMEAAELDGLSAGEFEIPDSEHSSDISDLEKLVADLDLDEDDDKGISDQVKTNPFLLTGKFPESLGAGLRVYEHALLQAIGESLLIDEKDLLSLGKDELVERLTEEIPNRLRTELRIHNGTDATLFHYLLKRNGALVSYERAMMLNDLIEKGFIFLFDRPGGYRVYITPEVESLLVERPLEEVVAEAKVFTMVTDAATALVNRRGVVKIEDVVDIINNEYHEAIKGYSFTELRRLIRSNLELHETEGLADFNFRRPYVYNETVDYETAVVIREFAETSNTVPKRLTTDEIRASLMPPFTSETEAWFDFLDLIQEDLNALDWALQEDVLRYLALLTAQETDLNIIVELLAEIEVDLEDVKQLEKVLRAYADYANNSPIWRLGGYSLNELNRAKTYEDRMAESIEQHRHADHSHHNHDHDHDHHGHHHHH